MRKHKLSSAGAALVGVALSVLACSSGPPSASQFVKDVTSKGAYGVDVMNSGYVGFTIKDEGNNDDYLCVAHGGTAGPGDIMVDGWLCVPVESRDKTHKDAAKLGGSVVTRNQ